MSASCFNDEVLFGIVVLVVVGIVAAAAFASPPRPRRRHPLLTPPSPRSGCGDGSPELALTSNYLPCCRVPYNQRYIAHCMLTERIPTVNYRGTHGTPRTAEGSVCVLRDRAHIGGAHSTRMRAQHAARDVHSQAAGRKWGASTESARFKNEYHS